MNGDEFYYEFKQALNFLGVGFHGMSEVEMTVEHDKVVLSAGNKECSIKLPKREAAK